MAPLSVNWKKVVDSSTSTGKETSGSTKALLEGDAPSGAGASLSLTAGSGTGFWFSFFVFKVSTSLVRAYDFRHVLGTAGDTSARRSGCTWNVCKSTR